MKKLILTAAFLLLASPAFAIDLTLPAKVTGQPGDFITVPAVTTGTIVKWVSLDAGLKLFPIDLLKNTKTAVVMGPTGSYRLLCYTADKDGPSDPAICTVVIGDAPPGPTPPGPTPVPVTPLTKTLQAAYALDSDIDRVDSLAFLATTYKGLATRALTQTTLKTNADFVKWMKTYVEDPDGGLKTAQVKNLRTAIGKELASAWGTASAPLAPADAAAELASIAKALSGVR